MAGKVRLNKVIELLEHGQAVFSCGTVPNGNFDEIATLGQSAYDMIIIETEHVGFDFPTLRHSLQYLLNRKRIVEKGNLQPDVVPLVRIPPYTRERNEWVVKQTLDAGPFGLVLPHLDTVEGAQAVALHADDGHHLARQPHGHRQLRARGRHLGRHEARLAPHVVGQDVLSALGHPADHPLAEGQWLPDLTRDGHDHDVAPAGVVAGA